MNYSDLVPTKKRFSNQKSADLLELSSLENIVGGVPHAGTAGRKIILRCVSEGKDPDHCP